MKNLLMLLALMSWGAIQAQPSVKVEVSKDTIAINEIVEVTYTIENGDGQFEPPSLQGLPLISGPNTSSSFVYTNGKMSSSQSYAYLFRPTDEGVFRIPAASYKDKSKTLKIDPVEIMVNRFAQPSATRKIIPQTEPAKPAREKKKF